MAAGRAPNPDTTASGRRIRIALACSVCGNRNYKSSRARREGDPLSFKKFCSTCNRHTVHIEGK